MQHHTIFPLAIPLITSRRDKMRVSLPSVLIALLCCTLSAYAQGVVGTSTLIFDYPGANANDSAINVTLVTAVGERWYAVEWFNSTNMMPALDLFWDNTTMITRKPQPLPTNPLAAGNAMYPGIVTWGTHPYVYVVGKADVNNSPQLQFFRQDRYNLGANPSSSTLGTAPMGPEHSRPHLAFDEDMGSGLGTNQMYVCWTAKNGIEEDVKSKAKAPGISWQQVPLHDIAVQAGIVDDHCEQSFNHAGDRYTVYHSENGGHGTWLHIDHWDATTQIWTDIADFELLSASGMSTSTNFPSTATSADANTTHHLVVAKRHIAPFDLISWTCDAVMAGDCEIAQDWNAHYLRQALRGWVYAPKAVVHGADRYVFYEDRSGTPILRLYKMCAGAVSWSEVGEIPPPDANHTGTREFNADLNSSAVSTFTVDRNNAVLHAIFVAQKDGTTSYNPAHWELDISGGCAGL